MKRDIGLITAMVLIGSLAGATAQRRPAPATATIEVYKSPT
jgi:hypothetical protein